MKKALILAAICLLMVAGTVNAAGQRRKIGMAKAREIASAKALGKIESSELENEHHRWVYSFDVRNAKGTITEVQVDAYTGEVVSVEEENAQQEAAEKRADAQRKRTRH